VVGEFDRLFLSFQAAVAGRYSLEHELGRGGMGIVYLAREVRLDRLVAIKLLPPAAAAATVLRERFLREARTAAKLSHPNIVPIYAADEVGAFVFYVMAYVSGETLTERVRTRGPLRPVEAARVLREVAWALEYAHAHGVVHRDIKPDNILLESGSGRAQVTDFGIAQLVDADGLTADGMLLGTPEFMSPEQASGQAVDARSDVYSLGVVGYYALWGRTPFEAPTVSALLAQQITAPAPAVTSVTSGVPRKLERAISRCLSKEPERRFETATAFAEAVATAVGQPNELPALLRAFLAETATHSRLRLFPSLLLVSFFVPLLLGRLLATFVHTWRWSVSFAQLANWLTLAALVGGSLTLVGLELKRLRRLVSAGYAHPDLVLAVQSDTERRREEWALDHPRMPVWLHGLVHKTWLGALGVFTGLVVRWLASWGPYLGLDRRFMWGLLPVAAIVAILGAPIGRAAGVLSGARLRFWQGIIGKWLFKVAGVGTKRRLMPGTMTHRPTEFSVALAAEALYEALSKEIRHALGELPGVLHGLEADAQHMRRRIDELNELLAEAAQRSSPHERARETQATVTAKLCAARDIVEGRLGEIVAALETIRLDLLRLRAGVGSVETITADLVAAREVGEQVDRLVQGQHEVRQILAERAPK